MCNLSRGHDRSNSQACHWHALAFGHNHVRLVKKNSLLMLCRPGVPGAPLPARAILSMGGLSHGVIRVNTEDKNSALTVQDVGHVMPGGEEKKRGEDF